MATDRQKKAAQLYVESGGKSASAAMRKAGYSPASAKNPKKLTASKSWEQLLDKALPDRKLTAVHKKLLNAQRIEHMVFPLGMDEADIKKLLNSVGCKPKKVQHGESAIHVWYWSPDNKAQAAAVELGYKVKGKLVNHVDATVHSAKPLLGGTTPMVEDDPEAEDQTTADE